MFRVENNVPEVYVTQSRDFQLFSRLYDLVFQSSRFSIDSLEQVSDTMRCNDSLLPLIATKVGFFTESNFTTKSDRQVLAAFPYIIRYKGSLEGIHRVANLFERIMNTSVYVDASSVTTESKVSIVFDNYAPDATLLFSLLEYIRPTGLLIDYVVTSSMSISSSYTVTDNVSVTKRDAPYNELVQTSSENINSDVGFAQII